MSLYMGIDPTASGSGAAAVLRACDLVEWHVWTRVARGWRIRSWNWPERLVDSLHGVGVMLACGGQCDAIAVEGLFSPARWQRRASGADVLALAEALGETLGPIRRRSAAPILRPTAREWRAILGASRLDARAAEDAAIRWVVGRSWMPEGLTCAEQGALAEAICMARWAEEKG